MSKAVLNRVREKESKVTKEKLTSTQSQYKIKVGKPEERETDPVEFSRGILYANNVSLVGGPFHFHIRSGTYGDPYDEIPWKVRMGMAVPRERHGYTNNPFVCQYEPRTLINNWVEEQRDKNFIKYKAPRLSQYGHNYISETMKAFKKPVCNKQRDLLLNLSTFPLPGHPGHQPELNVGTVRCSGPRPESCVVDDRIEKCKKEMECQKRYYRASM